MHALIIEDEFLIAMTIEDILRTCGFTTFDVTDSASEAIEFARRQCPALITSDVDLRPGCGIEAVGRICSSAPIPVIFITASASEVERRMPRHLLLVKPFTAAALKTAVSDALGRPA